LHRQIRAAIFAIVGVFVMIVGFTARARLLILGVSRKSDRRIYAMIDAIVEIGLSNAEGD
jgi:hypothetical protein